MSTLQVNRIIPLTGSSVYIQGAVMDSASFAITAGTASFAVTSSYSDFAVTSSYATTVGFNFVQSMPNATWTINHNLDNQHPLVQVYDVNHVTFIPQSISGSDANTVIVTFSSPVIGYARVV